MIEAHVYVIQPSPNRQVAWILDTLDDGRWNSIRHDVYGFINLAQYAMFWKMVTAQGGGASLRLVVA